MGDNYVLHPPMRTSGSDSYKNDPQPRTLNPLPLRTQQGQTISYQTVWNGVSDFDLDNFQSRQNIVRPKITLCGYPTWCIRKHLSAWSHKPMCGYANPVRDVNNTVCGYPNPVHNANITVYGYPNPVHNTNLMVRNANLTVRDPNLMVRDHTNPMRETNNTVCGYANPMREANNSAGIHQPRDWSIRTANDYQPQQNDSATNDNFTTTQLCSMSLQSEESAPPLPWSLRANRQWRNLVAYWLLGLCNNYGYVVMLSAAHDILSQNFNTNTVVMVVKRKEREGTGCSEQSAQLSSGAIFECSPASRSLEIEELCTNVFCDCERRVLGSARILLVVLLEAGGFVLVAFATADWMALLGVVSTSLGSGLGEVTLLSYSTFFDKNVVSTWSSGTGGAGILGASSYAGLTSLGLSPSKSLLIMLVIPALMAFS
uniref:Battenin n=1 Tax=Timema douglasi TaxID=61478 RepID=A0A7R8VGR7_TIMDO|nr:unnamed protein product [Timema douglasi]